MRKEKMEVIALDMLTITSLEEVAAKNGISVSTLYKLRQQDTFIQILKNKKNEIFGDVTNKLQGYSLEALNSLIEIVRTAEKDADRISAIRIILDGAKAAYERDEIMPKLAEVEQLLKTAEEQEQGKWRG